MSFRKACISSFFSFLLFGLVFYYSDNIVIPNNDLTPIYEEISSQNSHYNNFIDPPENVTIHPVINNKDIIYKPSRNTVPIVNEEYNVIFFQVAKAASSEWTRFFIRLNNDPTWCSNSQLHDSDTNGLKYLSDYSREEAREMMTDPKWTKAIFVRHPKPRILSAFLDKAYDHSINFITKVCGAYWFNGKNFEECLDRHENFEFFLREITTTLSDNVHWRSIYSRIDQKWWPYINYIGHMESISEDARWLLKHLYSNIDGTSAWDKIGKSGWSENERDCNSTVAAKGEFLAKRDIRHTTSARDKMLQYYTPELERFVEEHYSDDLNNPYFDFEPLQLF
jgi:hypothetical protein